MKILRNILLWLALVAGAVQPVLAGAPAIPPSAPANSAWQMRLNRIRAAAASAAASNPLTAGAASGVTLTASSTTDASLNINYTGTALNTYFSYSGGSPYYRAANTGWYFPVASETPGPGNAPALGNGTLSVWGYEVAVQTLAPRIQFAVNGSTTTYGLGTYGVRVRVNGQYISQVATSYVTASGVTYFVVDFSGVVTPRTIVFESSINSALIGIRVSGIYTIAPATPVNGANILAMVTGDSYTESYGASVPGMIGWARMAGQMAGWRDTRQVAVGGSGYLANNAGVRSTIRQQIPTWSTTNTDIAMSDVDIVVIASGYNDVQTSQTPSAVQAEALLDFQLARTTCPNALIIVVGPWAGAQGPSTPFITMENAIHATFTAWADPHSLWIPNDTDTPPWFSGTGYVGATTGGGISDIAVNTDGIHPTDIGSRILAERFIAWYRKLLSTLPVN